MSHLYPLTGGAVWMVETRRRLRDPNTRRLFSFRLRFKKKLNYKLCIHVCACVCVYLLQHAYIHS